MKKDEEGREVGKAMTEYKAHSSCTHSSKSVEGISVEHLLLALHKRNRTPTDNTKRVAHILKTSRAVLGACVVVNTQDYCSWISIDISSPS